MADDARRAPAGQGPLSRVLPAVGHALHALGVGRHEPPPPPLRPTERVVGQVRRLVADAQVLHDVAAERVGRNDHTMREFVLIRDRLADLVGEDGAAVRTELSTRFDDPEQCTRMARLVGGDEVLTIQAFDAYRYARARGRGAGSSVDELFLVVERGGGAGRGAPEVVAVLPLDPDTLQWEDALRGGSPEAWLRELTRFVEQDAAAVSAQVGQLRRS
ncbi:hypothetical protein [Vallicoccus soli]|uniref:hypothetical protein n=1 Tax=Vallicoccus soli TaxID=2339232 RepID=UPI00105937E6|nr:hypothetical protein [Vallicoccus soli]